jgi:hypothetical protein
VPVSLVHDLTKRPRNAPREAAGVLRHSCKALDEFSTAAAKASHSALVATRQSIQLARELLILIHSRAALRCDAWGEWLHAAIVSLCRPARASFARQWLLSAARSSILEASIRQSKLALKHRCLFSSFAVHLRAETAGLVSLRPLDEGTPQFERCERAIWDNLGAVTKEKLSVDGSPFLPTVRAAWQLEHRPLLQQLLRLTSPGGPAHGSSVRGLFAHLPVTCAPALAAFGFGGPPEVVTHPHSLAGSAPGGKDDPRRVFTTHPMFFRQVLASSAAAYGAPSGSPLATLSESCEASPFLTEAPPTPTAHEILASLASIEANNAQRAGFLGMPSESARLGSFARGTAENSARVSSTQSFLPVRVSKCSAPPSVVRCVEARTLTTLPASTLTSVSDAASALQEAAQLSDPVSGESVSNLVMTVLCRVITQETAPAVSLPAAVWGTGPTTPATAPCEAPSEYWSLPIASSETGERLVVRPSAIVPEFFLLVDWSPLARRPSKAAAPPSTPVRDSAILVSALQQESAGKTPAASVPCSPWSFPVAFRLDPSAAAATVALDATTPRVLSERIQQVSDALANPGAGPSPSASLDKASLQGAGLLHSMVPEHRLLPSTSEREAGWATNCAGAAHLRMAVRRALGTVLRLARTGLLTAGVESLSSVAGSSSSIVEAARSRVPAMEGTSRVRAKLPARATPRRGEPQTPLSARSPTLPPRAESTPKGDSQRASPRRLANRENELTPAVTRSKSSNTRTPLGNDAWSSSGASSASAQRVASVYGAAQPPVVVRSRTIGGSRRGVRG